jgi:hypothetical protein
MFSIPTNEVLAKLALPEIEYSLRDFLAPLSAVLPDKRLRDIVPLAVQGILASQSPLVTQMAQGNSRLEGEPRAVGERFYRFFDNQRFTSRDLFHGLYRLAQRTVEREQLSYLVIAIDPVNFEKPYTRKLEGVSTVRKSTPPALDGKARLTRGYPAITASIVNTRVPATTYANYFSYKLDFISEKIELRHSIRMSRLLFPKHKLRFVGDSGLDDEKLFQWVSEAQGEFIIRAQHMDRLVEVYNERLGRWETEHLADLTNSVPFAGRWQVVFEHARKQRLANMGVGWLRLRLPETGQLIWTLVAEDEELQRTLVLLTNVPLEDEASAQQVYNDWRLRSRIEHGYRFDQEQGLDVEDMRLHDLEGMKRIFALVLAAAQFVYEIMAHWPPRALHWLRKLGGKLDMSFERDGPYVLLRGLRAVLQAAAALTHLALHPFPHEEFS